MPSDAGRSSAAKVVVATTVALSFISFWRAAAIVLSDLASSAFYAGGIAEHAIGKSAPWFILGVMLFSFAVRSVYMESSSMFVRGGVYVVVRDSMGPFVARLSVSSLIFDYILTGPISVVSAGQYMGHLINEISDLNHLHWQISPAWFAAGFGVIVTGYFWWSNIKGIHESSGQALRIMQITTVMVVAFLIWCPITILLSPKVTLPPAPVPSNLQFAPEALGWLKGTIWPQISFIAVIVAFGHSLLSMSGFETLAQVYREIAYPKLKNLRITGNIVCTYAVVCTGIITLFAGIIIPDSVRPLYVDNLLGGLAMHLAGPKLLRLLFHVFVVIVGTLILSGAVNTSIIGANGVMNRIAEDGVLLDWFRKPQHRFGTTFRIINLIALLQIATILLSRGNVYLLGEAYAFGVVWSFFLKSLGVLVLRYHRHDQEYKFPGNLHIGGVEIPVGLGATTLVLFLVAIANLFSKQIATIYGVAFTAVFFVMFTISERVNARKLAHKKAGLEEFNLDMQPEVTAETVHARPGCVLVAVRDYQHLTHLQNVLSKTNLRRHDIVVMTVRPVSTGAGEYELSQQQLFSDYEKELLSRVVTLAEKEGKHVDLIVVPGVDPFDAMVQTAANVKASRLVTGVSARMDSDELARRIGLAWERLPEPRHPFSLEIISPGRPSVYVNLGPHPPRLWPEDVGRAHEIWLRLTEAFGSRLHHRDVIGVALRRLQKDLDSERKEEVLADLDKEIHDPDKKHR
ncbi:MAG TPA: APC family permease [Candidatus Sulfopaludibacter sp.]|jgi:amino acid transporter|nr:APC family permease [Candidatus Sulfopaludibacter sp.]